jgi:UDP-N-acetylmuramate--alanine ligase
LDDGGGAAHLAEQEEVKAKKIHLVGVCGAGMAGLAVLYKALGYEVDGCDLKPGDRARRLESMGIAVRQGHGAEHAAEADEVVYSAAVDPGEEELKRAKVLRSRGEALAEIASAHETIAVCGSHGKTTTATFVAKLLKALGEKVSWCIGGETGDFPLASAQDFLEGVLVVEADESDGTLAGYRAHTLVVNKCEYDHPDHFPTAADYFKCFETARAAAGDVIDSESLSLEGWNIPAFGEHNRINARAAAEVAMRRGHSKAAIEAALADIVRELPDRRFERLAEGVYTDYAHHPSEMACAISMARSVCKGRLRVLFQPHRYSRTKALLDDFPAAFAGADEVVLCPTYAAFERPVEGGDVADLYLACRNRDVAGLKLARSCEEAWTYARLCFRPGDVTLLLGAGDIIELSAMVKADKVLEPVSHWLGMGSNTWRSDLALNETYRRSDSPAGRSGSTLGIPWMAGIPGTIGGWVKMNAGAFGHSIGEVISRVKVDGRWLSREECGFAYRHSDIDGEIQDVEWSVDLAGLEGDAGEYLARRKRFPAHTWGSFFKNPPGDAAGRLLEAAGAKSLKVGGAYVWSEHANVIVAGEGSTPSDVLALARLMHWRVMHRFGIALESEVRGIMI